MVAAHSNGQTIFSFTHIGGITLCAGEEVDEIAGGAGMGVNRIGEVGDRVNEGQAAMVYGTGFTVGSLARIGARDGSWRPGIKVGSDKQLMEIGRMAEGDKGGAGKKVASGGIRCEDVVTFLEDTPQRMKTRVVGGD